MKIHGICISDHKFGFFWYVYLYFIYKGHKNYPHYNVDNLGVLNSLPSTTCLHHKSLPSIKFTQNKKLLFLRIITS